MKAFADPRLAGYLEGIEQEIIEVTRAIEEARGRHAPRKAARLEVRRRRLYEDLAYGAELLTRRAAGRAVHIHALPVQQG